MNSNTLTLKTINLPIFLKFRSNLILKIFWIFNFILILVFLIFYLFQVNALVSETYLVQNYEKKLTELSQKNEILTINFFQANSLDNIEKLIKDLGFEKVDKIHYIKIPKEIVTK